MPDALVVEPLEPRVLLSAELGLAAAIPTLQKSQALIAPALPAAVPVVLPAVQTSAASLNKAAATAAAAPAETWIGGAQGNWDNAANWSGSAVPDATTDVKITGTVSVALGNNDSADGLTLSGGVTLSGGALSTAGAGSSAGSTFSAVALSLGAPLTLSGTNTMAASTVRTASGGGLTNTGTLTFNGTAAQSLIGDVDNAGVLALASGSLGFTGGTLTSETGARLTVAAGTTLDLTEGGGETYGGTLTATGAGTVSLAGGVVAADATNGLVLNMSGPLFQWTGGVIDGVGASLANFGTITLSGSGTEYLGGTLDNSGVIQDSGQLDLEYGTYSTNYRGAIDNTGTFALAGDGGIGGFGPVQNSGLFAKTAGTATSTVGVGFDNTRGTIAVDSGTLELTSGTESGGAITTQAGATLLLTGPYENTFTLSGTLTGSGAGTVTFDNAGIGVDPAGATVDFAPGQLHWIDGNLLAGSTGLRNTGDITFSNATPGATSVQIGGTFDNFGAITNDGAITANTSDDGAATVINESGGSIALQDGGTIAGAFTIANSGLLRMSAGALSSIAVTALNLLPAGTVEVDTGTLELASGGTEDGQDFHVQAGATLDLAGADYAGTLTSTGSGLIDLMGGVIAAGGATLDFAPGVASWTTGAFDARLATLTNAGALTLSGPDTKIIGGSSLANSGTITQSGGSLQLYYPTYSANYGGTLDNSGTYDITDDSGISGGQVIDNTGTLLKTGGSGTTDLGAVVDTSGTFGNTAGAMTVDDGFGAAGGTIEALAGTLTLAGGTVSDTKFDTTTIAASQAQSEITFDGDVTLGGVVSGVGTGLVILGNGHNYLAAATGATLDFAIGELQFQGGVLAGGTAGLVNAGDLTVNQQTAESQVSGLFINRGTLALAAVSAFEMQSGASITNAAGAVIDFQGDGGIFGPGGAPTGVLLNEGTIRKSAGAESPLTIGTLAVSGAGTFALDAGTIDLDVNTLTGTFASTGTATLALVGVNTGADATLDFSGDALQWTSGVIDVGTGTLTNIGTLTLSGTALKDLGGTLTNVGAIIQDGGTLGFDAQGGREGGVLDNQGLYDITDDGDLYSNYVNGALFDNTGVLRKSGGAGLSRVNTDNFSNTGTVDVSSGTLSADSINIGALQQLSGGTLTAGTWTVENGATLTFEVPVIGNAATIAISGAGSTVDGLSALAENTGTLSVSNGASLELAGTLDNGGLLLAGPAGAITIDGGLDETAAGTMETVLDGRPASHDFGTIAVTGTAALAGTFDVALATGFAPTGGDSYIPLTFASASGSFASLVLPAGVQASVQAGDVALNVAASGPDLAVGAVTIETAAAAPGQPVTVQFTVANKGGGTATGSWTDSVYLSTNGVLDPDDVLLGRVDHTGDVAAGASYTASLTAALPPLVDGAYTVVVLADSRDQVADSNRADNLGASPATLAVATPVLAVGQTVSGAVAGGGDAYYRIAAQPGDDISLAASFAAAGDGQIYLSNGSLPTTSSFDQRSTAADAAQALTLANAAGGDVYVLVHGLAGGAFSLTASSTPLSITALLATQGGHDNGNTPIALQGTRFTAATTLSLAAADGMRYAAASVNFVSDSALYADFDLTKVPLGQYSVVATDGSATATVTTLFSVVSTIAGSNLSALISQVNSPARVGVGGQITVTVTLMNSGDAAATVTGYRIDATSTAAPSAELVNPGKPVTVPAHGKMVLSANFTPEPQMDGVVSGFSGTLEQATDSPLDLAGLSADIKPPTVSQAAWDAVFSNVEAAIGTTEGSLYAVEQQDDVALQQTAGAAAATAASALELEVLKASDALPTPVLDSASDISYPAPGISLSFGRAFQSSIIGRYTDGRLGQAWVDNWDYAATTDTASKTVTIQEGAALRNFTANADGSFTASPGDSGTLTETGGAYRLTDPDGDVTQFNADGTLDYVEDANGNRITAGYTGGLMTSLTAANGDALTIAYNRQGKIATVTDPAGAVASYSYDPTGQLLLGVTTAAGTSSYTYGTATTGPTAFELASVRDPGGTNVFFSYDSQGRLAKEEGHGGGDAVTFAYGANSIRVTDAAGDAATYYFDQGGATVATVDALGHATSQTINDIGEVTSTGEIGGGRSTVSTTSSAAGTTTTVTGPTGGVTTLTYGANLDKITSSTDQDGNVTGYSYAANGDLAAVTYADGSKVSFTEAADGSLTQSVDRDGTAASYTYDPRGLLLSQTLSNGATSSYTYDAHGNVLTATDASGTITMTYNGSNELTKIVYSNGQFLAYAYDAGGRRTQSTDQDGFVTNYSYDAQGQLASVTNGAGGLVARYTYDAVGRLVRQDNGNGTYSTRSYDANGDVLSIVNDAPDGTVNSSFVYTYDAHGRAATMTTLAGTARYSYDAAGRLTGATLASGTIITYAYDAAGNRTAVVETGVATTYTANDLDEYITVGGSAQSYDAAGDLTGGGGSTYTYNALGQLTSVVNASGGWSYTYNALGERNSETHDGVVTTFLVDPASGSIVAEYDATGALLANYVYGDGLTSRVGAGGAEYYDFDALGSTAGLSGTTGSYVASYTYDPAGNLLSSTGSAANRFLFNGAAGVQSDGSGLVTMGARGYDPQTGRFTQPDPAGISGGINPYVADDNDPVGLVDPSGLAPLDLDAFRLNYKLFGDMALPAGQGATDVTQLVEDQQSGLQMILQNSGLTEAEYAAMGVADRADVQNVYYNTQKFLAPTGELSRLEPELVNIATQAEEVVEENPAPTTLTGLGLLGLYGVGTSNFAGLAIDAVLTASPYGLITGALLGGIFLGNYLYDYDVKHGSTFGFGGNSSTKQVKPQDPNFIAGPTGYGAGHYIIGGGTAVYEIGFTNEPTADAPARTVTITEQLDPNLDLSTFALGSFGFGGQAFDIPTGLQSYTTRIDDRAAGVFVDFSASLDVATRTLTVSYTSIDPATLDDEADVSVGFLPPDNADPNGAGFLSYTVATLSDLATGSTVTAQASVVFDTNVPVVTNTYVNTIDDTPPASQVTALPPVVASPAIALSWSGTDGAGSGIASYTIYVSVNGSAYTAFLQDTTATSATFTGAAGHSYSFYSTAVDNLGYAEAPPATADATTRVDTAPVAATITGSVSSAGPAITLQAVYTDTDTGDSHSFTVNMANTKGSVTNNGNGTFTYNPNGAFAGLKLGQTATDSFSYTVTDGEGLSSTAVATVTLTGVDTAPVATDITGSVSSAGPAITLKAVYTDPDAGDSHSFTVNTANTKGSVTNNGNGTFTYNPNGAFAALTLGQTATDSFSYTVTDGEGLSSTAVATITVTGVDTAPVATNITGAVTSAGPAITLKAVYTDPDAGDSHSFTVSTTITKGSVTNNGNGAFTYNPNGAFAALTLGQTATDSFRYTVTDGEGLSSTGTATITVTGVDTAPVASNITGAVSSTGPAITLTATYTDPDAGDSHSFTVNTADTKGTATNNGNGTFTYNPNGAFAALTLGQTATDSFRYTVTDGEGLSSTGTATITVTGVDTAPVASNITGAVSSTGPAITLTATYTDPDAGDSHSFTVNTADTKGTATNNGNGTFTYNPNGAFAALTLGQRTTDSFSYTVTDGEGLSSAATATITVTGVDTAPVAANITGSVSSGGPTITLTAAYTDPDAGDSHSFTVNTANTKGTVTNNGNGTFTYNPNGAFAALTLGQTATDSFSYTVTDGEGLSSTATATITVTGVSAAPVANADGPYTAITNKPLIVDAKTGLLANDTGPTGEKLSVVPVKPPSHGTLQLNKDGSFSYVADCGYVGPDSFTYKAVDANGASAPATVSIDVQNTLTLRVAADDFQGGANFTVAVDGMQVGGVQTVSSSFAAGQYKDITLSGDFVAAPKQITVTFINDLYQGTPQTDRNLYVESLSIDGHFFLGSAASNPVGAAIGGAAVLYGDGTLTFNTAPTKLAALTLRVAADKFMGGAEFTIAVDGVQVGGTLLAERSFSKGQYQDITLVGNFGPDPRQVSVSFIKDLYGGTPSTDRNLYVESLTFDGRTIPGAAAANPVGKPVGRAAVLYSDGTITFTLPYTNGHDQPGGNGWTRRPQPLPGAPSEICILTDVAARGFHLAYGALAGSAFPGDAPALEPWVVALVRGQGGAHGSRDAVVVDLSGRSIDEGSAPCAS